MFELSISDYFAAAHYLKGYEGACKDIHGHTFKVDVAVLSPDLNNLGLGVDFGILKKKLKDFLAKIDHSCLNDLEPFKDKNPTSEYIAQYIHEGFAKECQPLTLKYVRVWESRDASVTYYP